MALGPTSQHKKIFLIFFSANISIAILGLTNTGIFELELAVLEQLPMWRRVFCEIHAITFFFFPTSFHYRTFTLVQKYSVFPNSVQK